MRNDDYDSILHLFSCLNWGSLRFKLINPERTLHSGGSVYTHWLSVKCDNCYFFSSQISVYSKNKTNKWTNEYRKYQFCCTIYAFFFLWNQSYHFELSICILLMFFFLLLGPFKDYYTYYLADLILRWHFPSVG